MGLLRDHYEGTAFDLTKGLGAGETASIHRLANKTECSHHFTALPVYGDIGHCVCFVDDEPLDEKELLEATKHHLPFLYRHRQCWLHGLLWPMKRTADGHCKN